MTEVKITFTKVGVKKISDSDAPANAKGLEIDTSPIFLDKFYDKVPSDSCANNLKLAFFDGVEEEIYNELLDEEKIGFELSFEKEKVDFNVVGVDRRKPDDTKIRINYAAEDSANGILGIVFKPQFAGVVKIKSKSKLKDKDKNSPQISELEKEITNLKSRIKDLENKKDQAPDNSADYQRYNQQIQQLNNELKEKEKEKEQQSQNSGGFPLKVVVIAASLIVGGIIALLVIILLLKKILKN